MKNLRIIIDILGLITAILALIVAALTLFSPRQAEQWFHDTFIQSRYNEYVKILTPEVDTSSVFRISEGNENQSAPERVVTRLDGVLAKTIGYWAGGAKYTEFSCYDKLSSPNTDLVIVSTREVNIGRTRSGSCAAPDYCDSHNEFCVNVYFQKACYVNKEWHDWYKNHCIINKIPYSKDAVCSLE